MIMLERREKLCPYCGGSGIDDNAEVEENSPLPECDECGGTGYIEQVRHKPVKVKSRE